MYSWRQYILTIVAAAVLIAIITRLTANFKIYRLIKMLAGVAFVFTLLSPFCNLKAITYAPYLSNVNDIVGDAVTVGENIYRDNLIPIITDQCETYILDRASQLDAIVTVRVQCDASEIPRPNYIEIAGNISPYARKQLKTIIETDLGIPEENQVWT